MKLRNKFLISLLVITFSILLFMATKTRATTLEDIVTINEIYQDKLKLSGDRLYVKLDPKHSEGYLVWNDVLDKIEVDYENYKDGAYTAVKPEDKTVPADTIETGCYRTFVNKNTSQEYRMNVYIMGDVYTNNSGKIDIEDIMYLRQAIVGNDMSSNLNFYEETSDVNWSNGTTDSPQLGDIGDVISIRKRILTNKWTDNINRVTEPPTEPVDEKTEYDDPNSENDYSAVIPEGFKVSDKEDEQDSEEGLVVIAPDGSEFVWIPVKDASTIYGVDEDGNKLGKLYDEFIGTDKYEARNWTETDGVMSWTKKYRI